MVFLIQISNGEFMAALGNKNGRKNLLGYQVLLGSVSGSGHTQLPWPLPSPLTVTCFIQFSSDQAAKQGRKRHLAEERPLVYDTGNLESVTDTQQLPPTPPPLMLSFTFCGFHLLMFNHGPQMLNEQFWKETTHWSYIAHLSEQRDEIAGCPAGT